MSSSPDEDPSPTEVHGRGDSAGSSRLSLLVMTPNGVFTLALPGGGEVTIGRAADCDARVDDAKASRLHAVLTLAQGHALLTDKGSRNGTLVGDRRLVPEQPVPLSVGDMVMIGSTAMVLQTTAAHAPPKRIFSETVFEQRVEEERRRAERHGATCGILRIRIPDRPTGAGAPTSTSKEAAELARRAEKLDAALNESLRPFDVIAARGPGLYEVLLPDTAPDVAKAVASRLASTMRRLDLPGDVAVTTYPNEPHAAPVEDDEEPPRSVSFEGSAMARMRPLVERVAQGAINVLVLGETGAGKEVMARTIHERSPRAAKPMVCINCAALSETLLESELFGHERGAFTGAVQSKPGLLEAADGGTVFLDEIGEMPLTLQAKLLRVLEQREVQRVGALKPRPIDVRFVAATNRDLEQEIEKGRFRQDLYFRLNGIALTLPPLRERRDEIEPLARAFVQEACVRSRRERVPSIARQVIELLLRYDWPGNVRELKNTMERAVLLCAGDVITIEHVPSQKMGPLVPLKRASAPPMYAPDDTTLSGAVRPRSVTLPEISTVRPRAIEADDERQRIVEALEKCAGNQTAAARLLGISRRTLVSRLGDYNLPRPRKPIA